MDARLVWDTWRRILTDDQLVAQVSTGGAEGVSPGDLSPEQLAIIRDYASTPAATIQNIGMYRRGLVRNSLGALSLAPLTSRILYTSTLDPEAVAEDFARSVAYRDYGPNFWSNAGDFVAFLAGLPAFAAPACQDAIAIDAGMIALQRRLSEQAPPVWPDDAGPIKAGPDGDIPWDATRFVASPAAVLVGSSRDIGDWIENPTEFDAGEPLPVCPQQWLIHVPAPSAAREYARLSDRCARVFWALRRGQTVAELATGLPDIPLADIRMLVSSLASLGVIGEQDRLAPGLPDGPAPPAQGGPLPDHISVMLDPSVELLDDELLGYRLLAHGHFSVGMAIPPGEGLLAVVAALKERPIRIGELRARFDNQQIVSAILESLHRNGFLYAAAPSAPSQAELDRMRGRAALLRGSYLRPAFDFSLDEPDLVETVAALLAAADRPPDLVLRAASLDDHAGVLGKLARLRLTGIDQFHSVVVQCQALSGDPELCRALNQLGATVDLEGVDWPGAVTAIPGLEVTTRQCVAVHAVMTPDLTILDSDTRQRAVDWAASVSLTGLRLRLDPDRLWPNGDPGDGAFTRVFEAVQDLENRLGDACIVNLPSDEVLLGNARPLASPVPPSALFERFRLAYLRWRLPVLKGCENDNSWSQVPEVEGKLVRVEGDYLPQHPEVLGLKQGDVLVDVCGGLGRVARRMSAAVGSDGMVISIEMFRCIGELARRFASERGFRNLHFRQGIAQRLPLPDAVADAAVNEWTGAIWELGLGPAMIGEMARVVRPGGRIATTHRLVRLDLARLAEPWVQYAEIYNWIRQSFERPDLTIVAEHIWGQVAPSMIGENATQWRKQYMPRLINPHGVIYTRDENINPCADLYMTIVAQKNE